MGRIQILEDDVVNKIAAGEVVERPASVVKELVENALDAGAKSITVSLELGGARSIAVTDDGCGMSAEDAVAALRRHATSKIRAADDLYRIKTMGFRGEALAAIAAVSRLTLSTSPSEAADGGTRVTASGSETPVATPWTGPRGTTMLVENLFFNMPVRARFLKAPATEFGHCLELVQAFALCHPEVSFRLRHNNRELFQVSPLEGGAERAPDGGAEAQGSLIGEAALRERAKAVLGRDFANLLYVRRSGRYGDLEALISPPGVEKPSGRHMHTFVNRRWVKDKILRYAVLRGYHSHLMKGRYPVVVLHMTMDPTLVDVNVHPAKTELRFQYPSEVQNLVSLAVRETLRDGAWGAAPELPVFAHNTVSEKIAPRVREISGATAVARPTGATLADSSGLARTRVSRSSFDGLGAAATLGQGGSGGSGASLGALPGLFGGGLEAFGGSGLGGLSSKGDIDRALGLGDLELPRTEEPAAIPWEELDYLGAFDRCFLFFAWGERLLVVDQHAFHERVLFERLVRDPSLTLQSQPLLVPESVEMAPSEVALLRERSPALAERGIVLAPEGETTVVVRAVPSILAGRNLVDLLGDLARDPEHALDEHESAREAGDGNGEIGRLVLATIACHASVRAGEELPPQDLKRLVAEARTVDFFHNCPHGRRVFRWWSRREVARWFDR
jgi:DNA mismatch repair protein MutL